MGISAEARASTALRGSSALPPARVLALVKRAAAGFVKTRGVPVRCQINVVSESDTSLGFSLTKGKAEVERCTFSASATVDGSETQVRVGGLESYNAASYKLYGLIPTGPKEIEGFVPYKRFLELIQKEIGVEDPRASLALAQADA